MKKTLSIKLILSVFVVCGVLLGYTAVTHASAVTFTDLNQKYLPGTSLDITNATGVTWTDFHFVLSPAGVGLTVGDYSGPGTAAWTLPHYLHFPDDFDYNYYVDVTGLSIPDGNIYSLSFTTGQGGEVLPVQGFIPSGHPTIEGQISAVPEPTTLLLVGAGLLGVGFFRRKFAI
jgi:hypothetical protein